MRSWLAALLLAGCGVDPDVVAMLSGDDEVALTDGGPDSSDAALDRDAGQPSRCAANTNAMLLLDSDGLLSRLPADTLEVAPLDLPECMSNGVLAAAVDQDGVIWTSASDRGLWRVTQQDEINCGELGLEASVTAMAFVFDPSANSESLYMLDAGSLALFDGPNLKLIEIGPLAASYLVGTNEGELLAVSELGSDLYTIEVVDLGTAKATLRGSVKRPGAQELTGATFWQGNLVLLFGSELHRYDAETDTLLPLLSLKSDYTNLMASECAAGAK